MGYEYWTAALALTGGKRSVTRDEMKVLGLVDEAQSGFFRKRTSRAGPFVPVALWHTDNGMVAIVDGKAADASEIWSFVCPHPITEAAYHERVKTGKWADEDVAIAASLEPPPAGMGDNNPPQDEAEILAGKIEAASANAADYETINDDETAAKAQSVRSRLLELSGDADKARTALVRPHLDAQNAINDKWQPLVKGAKSVADMIKASITGHENRQKAIRDKATADRAEALAAAQRAVEKAAAAGKPVPAPPPLPPAPEPVPEAKKIAGSYGRAASVKTIKVAKVVDQDAAYLSMKAHPEIVTLIAALAQRALKAGMEHTLKGVEIVEEIEVR